MKHLIFPAAALAAAFTLASCSSDDDAMQGGTQSQAKQRAEIAFATASQTRAGGAEITDLNTFTVFGTDATGATILDGVSYIWDNADLSYRSTPKYYWPVNGTLNFYAISTPGTRTITSGKPTYAYSNWAGTNDLVAAVALNQSTQVKVPLTFKHILTKVTTSVTDHSPSGCEVRVSRITMTAPNSGKYSFGLTSGAEGSWAVNASPTTPYAYDYNNTTACSDGWFVLPTNDVTFKVEYKVYQLGAVLLDCTGSAGKTVSVSLGTQLGKRVDINFVISDGSEPTEIKFTKTISDYATGTGSSHSI